MPLAALPQRVRQVPRLRLHAAQAALRLRLLHGGALGPLGKLSPEEGVLPLGLLGAGEAQSAR